MRQLVYTPRAELDIQEIWHYTATRWNVAQADRYIEQLLKTCDALAQGTTISRSADDIQIGYRKHSAGSHVIYFEESPAETQVVRILHNRMDAARQMDEE